LYEIAGDMELIPTFQTKVKKRQLKSNGEKKTFKMDKKPRGTTATWLLQKKSKSNLLPHHHRRLQETRAQTILFVLRSRLLGWFLLSRRLLGATLVGMIHQIPTTSHHLVIAVLRYDYS
jgi:hypothetical protein